MYLVPPKAWNEYVDTYGVPLKEHRRSDGAL